MRQTREFIVKNFLTNPEGYLRTKYLLGYCLQVSLDQEESMGEKIKELMKDKTWIIYSWDLKMEEPIRARDRIRVTTFAIDMEKLYGYRNFLVERDGKTVARAYCVFLLFDLKKKRPIRIPSEIRELYGQEEAIYEEGRHSYPIKDFEKTKKMTIRTGDLDYNGHVNNTAYLDFILDLTGVEDQDLAFFNILYKKEIRDKEYVLGDLASKGKEIFFRLRDDRGEVYSLGKLVKRKE